MCLAVPARVIAIDDDAQNATVALGQVRKRISIALLDEVKLDDYVLVHVGFALHVISPEEAAATLQLMSQAGLEPQEAFQ